MNWKIIFCFALILNNTRCFIIYFTFLCKYHNKIFLHITISPSSGVTPFLYLFFRMLFSIVFTSISLDWHFISWNGESTTSVLIWSCFSSSFSFVTSFVLIIFLVLKFLGFWLWLTNCFLFQEIQIDHNSVISHWLVLPWKTAVRNTIILLS